MKRLNRVESKNWQMYRPPAGSNYQTVKLNVIHLNLHNDLNHEKMKLDLVWELRKMGHSCITEAERNSPRGVRGKVVDVVDVTDGQEYEIIFKHESDVEIKAYRDEGIIPVIVGDSYICSLCGKNYPKRNEKGVCKNCE